MKHFIANIFLALIWGAISGFSPQSVLIGFFIGYVTLWVFTRATGPSGYFGKVGRFLEFTLFFLKELVVANFILAADVIRPGFKMTPGVVEVPLVAMNDAEISLLANLITLTPGTMSLDVSRDRKRLYIHAMHIKNREEFVSSIKEGFERRVLEVLR